MSDTSPAATPEPEAPETAPEAVTPDGPQGPEVPNVPAEVATPVGSPEVHDTGVNADTPVVNDGSANDQPRSTEDILANAPPLVLPDGTKFVKTCHSCGLQVEDPEPGANCPNCGTPLP